MNIILPTLRAERRKINEDISKIKIDSTKEKQSVKNLGGNQELIDQLTKEITSIENKIDKLRCSSSTEYPNFSSHLSMT